MKLSREERQQMRESCHELTRYLRYLEQLLDRPEEREWRQMPALDIHPIIHLNNLAGMAGIREHRNDAS